MSAALPILILSAQAADALTARYADRPCVAAMATPVDVELLHDVHHRLTPIEAARPTPWPISRCTTHE